VHGRWSYYRMCKFLRYFFYKNFAFTLCHFWYAFFCGFSAQTLLDPGFIAVYNVFYTSWPVLTLAFFDQDVNSHFSVKLAKLYTPGLGSQFFNIRMFAMSALHGFYTSMVLFMMPMGAYHDKTDDGGLVLADHLLFGSVVATILVIVVTAQVALDTSYWTAWNHLTIWGSLVLYFLLTFTYNWFLTTTQAGSLSVPMGDTTFWFTVLLTTVVLMLPVIAWRFYKVDVHPTLTDKAKLVQRSSRVRQKVEGLPRPFSGRRSRRSVRSGYAFAHSEGFGRLITSGRIMREVGQLARPGNNVINGLPVPKGYPLNGHNDVKSTSNLSVSLAKSASSAALSPPQRSQSESSSNYRQQHTDVPGIPMSD